jgi:hypothetical protein
MNPEVKLGALVGPEVVTERDAVHVAVIRATAVTVLQPGQRLANGIVDSFLTKPVQPGQQYWLMLYPGTVTSLHHVWTHPAYPPPRALPPKSRSEADVWADLPEVAPPPETTTQEVT